MLHATTITLLLKAVPSCLSRIYRRRNSLVSDRSSGAG